MRRLFSSATFLTLFLVDVGLLVMVIGFGKDGGWRFALDVVTLAIFATLYWDWWKERRKARGF